MPDNRNTDHANTLDAEDWEIAFQPYAGNPEAALSLGRLLMILAQSLTVNPPNVPDTLDALNEAAEVLYSHSHFHKCAYDLYRVAIEGRATRAQEALIEALGVKL